VSFARLIVREESRVDSHGGGEKKAEKKPLAFCSPSPRLHVNLILPRSCENPKICRQRRSMVMVFEEEDSPQRHRGTEAQSRKERELLLRSLLRASVSLW
jgi:hypothetical protein